MSRKRLITCRKPHLFPAENPEDPPHFPLPTLPYPVTNMTISAMSPMQIVNFSFISPEAAQAVKEAHIQLELLEIYLYSVYNGRSTNRDPQKEQGIELTFVGAPNEKVLWWCTNGMGRRANPENNTNFHKKTTFDGTVFERCFTKSEKVIGCVTESSEVVEHLKILENHFRSIFTVKNADVDINGLLVGEYKEYLDAANPKTVRNLRINSEMLEEDGMKILEAIHPENCKIEATPPDMVLEPISCKRISFKPPRKTWKMSMAQILALDCEEIDIGWTCQIGTSEMGRFINRWLNDPDLKCRDKLKMLKASLREPVSVEGILYLVNTMEFDENRRAGTWRKIVDREVKLELDLRTAKDIQRADGKLASVQLVGASTLYFVIWHDRFPERLPNGS